MTVRRLLLSGAVLTLLVWVGWAVMEVPTGPVAAAVRPPSASTAPSTPTSTPPAAPVPQSPEAPAIPSRSVDAVRALEPELAAFVERSLAIDIPDDATRDEEDDRMAEALQAHAAEARRLEERYGEVMAHADDPKATVLALLAVGDLKEALGADLEEAPLPTYLREDQVDAWRDAMDAKADAQFEAARDAWDRAATFAQELPSDPEVEALLTDRR